MHLSFFLRLRYRGTPSAYACDVAARAAANAALVRGDDKRLGQSWGGGVRNPYALRAHTHTQTQSLDSGPSKDGFQRQSSEKSGSVTCKAFLGDGLLDKLSSC